MIKTNILPILLVTQIIGLGNQPFLVRASYNSKKNAHHNYGYAVNFDGRGSTQGHKEERDGVQARGKYFVNLPRTEVHSDVQYIANNQGFQPVVRISTKDAHSQVSSHFALGSEAVKALNEQVNNSDNVASELLTDEVLIYPEIDYSTGSSDDQELVASHLEDEKMSKLVSDTYNLVSNEDVLDINKAAEEYFDDISDERLQGSRFDFVEKQLNDGFAHITRPVVVEEIIENSLPRSGSRSLNLNEREVVISPIKANNSNLEGQATTRSINVEILDESDRPHNFGDRILSKYLNLSPELNISSEQNANKTDEPNVEREYFTELNTTIPVRGSINYGPLSETVLAPIQAGLQLFNDNFNENDDFEDNVLSDTIQTDQKVMNDLENYNKSVMLMMSKDEVKDLNGDKTETTVVESYHSDPVIEIIEKTVEGNSPGEIKDQTFIYSTETHLNDQPIETATAEPLLSLKLNDGNFKTDNDLVGPNAIRQEVGHLTEINSFNFPSPQTPPYTFVPNQHASPTRPPISFIPIGIPSSYHVPDNVYYSTQIYHRPFNSVESLNSCPHCMKKVIKDDYFGPVPPVNEKSHWTMDYVRQQRQLGANSLPKIEYGFKPPLRPSIEIDEEGLPLVKNYH